MISGKRSATSANDDWARWDHQCLSRKLGKYPSELNWSSLGDVLGFIYVYRNVHRPSYAMSGNQWQMRSGDATGYR